MTGMGAVLAAGMASSGLPVPGTGLACQFDTACIDGRPCFNSALSVAVEVVGDALALVDLGDGRRRPALMVREGVWTSFQTEPDRDHALRTEILDIANDGRATLVVSSPGQAVEMLSRTGSCAPNPVMETRP